MIFSSAQSHSQSVSSLAKIPSEKYFDIVEKQGAVKVAYVNFIMPILSMLVSTFAEGYKWDIISATGLVVMLISVWLGIRPDKKRMQQQ